MYRKYKKKRGMNLHSYLFLVPLTGLEPVRILLRGILSPLCLPIPPQRRCFYYTTRSGICQGLFEKNLIFFLFLQIPCISSRIPPLFFRSNRFYIHEPLPCSISDTLQFWKKSALLLDKPKQTCYNNAVI